MKLSIIVTTYNHEKYLNETLQSIYEQCLNCEYEVIVGDDGSTDNTIGIIKSWKSVFGERFHFFVMDRSDLESVLVPSQRVSAICRRALTMMKGEYFCVISGDDFYTSKYKLQIQLEILEKPQNADCIGCTCQYSLYWDNGTWSQMESPLSKINEAKLSMSFYMKKRIFFHVSTFVFRNVFSNGTQYLEDILFIDDAGLTIYMGLFGKYYYLSDKMFAYRQTKTGIMNSQDDVKRALLEMVMMLNLYNCGIITKEHAWIRNIRFMTTLYRNSRRFKNSSESHATIYIDKEVSECMRKDYFWMYYYEFPKTLIYCIRLIIIYIIAKYHQFDLRISVLKMKARKRTIALLG